MTDMLPRREETASSLTLHSNMLITIYNFFNNPKPAMEVSYENFRDEQADKAF